MSLPGNLRFSERLLWDAESPTQAEMRVVLARLARTRASVYRRAAIAALDETELIEKAAKAIGDANAREDEANARGEFLPHEQRPERYARAVLVAIGLLPEGPA